MKRTINYTVSRLTVILITLLVFGIFTSCEKDEDYELCTYIKKTDGPIIVNQKIDFAFALASADESSLQSFEIKATYPGQTGTIVDTRCYWTLLDGKTYDKEMVTGVATSGMVTLGSVIDGIEWEMGTVSGYSSKAVTLRYTYIVPEEARGKKVQFDVKYVTKNGLIDSYSTIEYDVEKVDIATDVILTDPVDNTGRRYFSISEMKTYTKAEVDAQNKSAVIDFVYRYNINNITAGSTSIKLNTCIAAPSQAVYLSPDYIPASWVKNATLIESRKWDDMQLKGNTPNNYVAYVDIQNASFNAKTDGEYDLKKDFGLLMQTSDGKYRAFVYLKAVNAATATIGIKRLQLK